MSKKKGTLNGNDIKKEPVDIDSNHNITARNGKKSSNKDTNDEEPLDLFQLMANAAIEGYYPIEQIIEMCYSYGVAHGEILAKKLANNRLSNGKSLMEPPPLPLTSQHVQPQDGENTKQSNGSDKVSKLKQEGEENGDSSMVDLHRLKKGFKQDLYTNGFLPPPLANGKIKALPSSSTTHGGRSSNNIEDYKGVRISSTNDNNTTTANTTRRQQQTNNAQYQAFIEYKDHTIVLGDFDNLLDAVRAHDHAIIRLFGPSNCSDDLLNYNIRFYARDPIESFTIYDSLLKQELFGTNWNGLKDCDFSFLILPFPSYQEIHKARLKHVATQPEQQQQSQSSITSK